MCSKQYSYRAFFWQDSLFGTCVTCAAVVLTHLFDQDSSLKPDKMHNNNQNESLPSKLVDLFVCATVADLQTHFCIEMLLTCIICAKC